MSLPVTQHILFLCQKVMKEIGPILRPVRWLDVYVSAMTDSGAVDAFARQGYSYKTVIREKHIDL